MSQFGCDGEQRTELYMAYSEGVAEQAKSKWPRGQQSMRLCRIAVWPV